MFNQGNSLKPVRFWPKSFAIAFTLILSLLLETQQLFSQGVPASKATRTRERTRGFIDDYSSSLDNGFFVPQQPGHQTSGDTGGVEGKSIRPLVRAFSDNLTQLTYALNEQMGQVSGLRQTYTEALRLSGTAVSVNKYSERYGVDRTNVEQLKQLDADWRELAYRIESLRGLTDETLDLVKAVNDADTRIRQLIGIQPQLDRRQLYLKAASLAGDLDHLQEDLAAELGNGQDAQVYRRSVSRLRQIMLNLISVIRDERSDSKTIIEEYKQFETIWTPLIAKLRAEDDRDLDRGIRRVLASVNDVHQLLLLPQKLDQSQFSHLAMTLKKDIDEFLERTPLILVIHLPKAKQALSTADQFYVACEKFTEVVKRSQDQTEIMDAFRQIEVAERAFHDVYHDVDSDKAAAVLNRISQTVSALRSSLHVQRDEFDSRAAEELAASIQNSTEQIETITKRWVEAERPSFTQSCLQDAADLAERAARIHDHIVTGKPHVELKGEVTELYETWRRVYDYLLKCQTEDRQAMGRISSNLTPTLVELRTMILQ
jgi:hypothetical protein